MEDKNKEFLTWALSEFKDNISIFEQRWESFKPQWYFDYKIILKIEDCEYTGRGVAMSQSKAIAAALGESLERYAIKYSSTLSSNGFALHSSLNMAKTNSRREVIERHYVMLFTLGYFSGDVVQINELSENTLQIIEKLKKNNFHIVFYKLFSSSKETVVLCQLSGLKNSPPFGLLFGASCKDSILEAVEGSLREVLPNLMAFLNGRLEMLDEDEFIKIDKPEPKDHLGLYLNINFAEKYLQHRIFKKHKEIIDESLFVSTLVSYPYSDLYPVVYTKHPNCLDAKWGMINETSVYNFNPCFPLVLP